MNEQGYGLRPLDSELLPLQLLELARFQFTRIGKVQRGSP